MAFWIGWLCGLGTAVLHWLLWRRCLRRVKPAPPTPSICSSVDGARPIADTPVWAQTRNFLRYDGTEMPVIKQYKEEIHE